MTYSLNDAFEDASLVTTAPHYSQIAAALPERERERFLAGRYHSLFTKRVIWNDIERTAGHWANGYQAHRELLEEASAEATVLGEVITAGRELGRQQRLALTGAGVLLAMDRADEKLLVDTLESRRRFCPGFLMLTEGENLSRFDALLRQYNVTKIGRGIVTRIVSIPSMWVATPDFDALMLSAIRSPMTGATATRYVEAARALSVTAGFEAAHALAARYTIDEAEEFVGMGLALEYVLD